MSSSDAFRKQAVAGLECRGEAIESVNPTIYKATGGLQISVHERVLDLELSVAQEDA